MVSLRLAALAVAVGLADLAAATECSHNNCLRAIIALNVKTRDGLGDCNSYLLTTVYLPTRRVSAPILRCTYHLQY